MAIPKIKKQNILDALKYIDNNGVPAQNQSTKYELVTEEGKKYPPKYVIAVASLIGEAFYHPMNKGGKGAQRLFDRNIGLIYPDFISRNQENRIIADAKYKPIDNIGNKDYLQMLAYMFRFDAKNGFYLYPETTEANDLQLWLNKGSTYEKNVKKRGDICLIKHGLKIPIYADSYQSFSNYMVKNETEFRNNLLNSVN